LRKIRACVPRTWASDVTEHSRGLRQLLAARPQLQRVVTAAEVLGLAPHELLHAGPPLRDASQPPAVLLSSAVVTCLHEDWAPDQTAARALVQSGALRWYPAQDRGLVVPLATVVSGSTPLFEVLDEQTGARAWAPVSTVRGPDTRMGFRDAGLAARLAHRDSAIAVQWQEVLARTGPLPLYPLAQQGLAQGDDLHSRTTAANNALVSWLRGHTAVSSLADDVEATPLFFLTLWMAACSLALRAAEGDFDTDSTLITRAGGNGEAFGVCLASAPTRWVQVAATAPQGQLLQSVARGTTVCGAIGDSAVIDFLGFGGQRLAQSPEPLNVLKEFLPTGYAQLPAQLLAAQHPAFISQRVGMDVRAVVAARVSPLVTLAMLGADGLTGFVGRGVYCPPLALFEKALDGRR
jgi:hypothetical protein